jgi:PiT family inorganic phosphate transporter
MELERIHEIEQAIGVNRKEVLRLGISILFIVGIILYVSSRGEVSPMLIVAGMIGGYMALNIGANDVANNVGPAVGSRALTLVGAIAIAAIFEASGALIAGGDVVSTIKKGIIDPATINDTDVFVWLMMAALLAGALWLNIATAIGAPVSTTHSIVGGVLGAGVAAVIYSISKPWVARKSSRQSNDKQGVNSLFTIPLIFAAALLSFAHGANDVANSVGPLAAINDALATGDISTKASIPMWVMMVGAIGISLGLALYGPKLIRTVGSEITELDQMRAFCIALSAAITVIMATQLGLPVSSTHIAVGAIFGVGFLREYLKKNYARMVEQIQLHHLGRDKTDVEQFLEDFQSANLEVKSLMLQQLKEHSVDADLSKKERRGLKRVYHHELVKRSALLKIIAAWIITVPVSGLMAAMLFFMLRGMMLP